MKCYKKFCLCIYKSIADTAEHDGAEHAGYLAFLLMLAVFPFLFFLMAIVTLFGPTNLFEYIIDFILDNTIDDLVAVLKPRIKEITNAPPNSLLTFAIVSAIWTASSIFEAIRTILNKANRVAKPPSYLFRRFISIIEFMLIIFMSISVMFVFGVFPSLISDFATYVGLKNSSCYIVFENETRFFRDAVIIFYGCFFISFLYFFLPNKKQKFSHTIPGTICVILAWIAFTYLFKYYLRTFSQLNVIYGSIVGVIISLLYFYFCSIIFIFGAEFNYNFSRLFFKCASDKLRMLSTPS
ncbi:YihY/virulence factor BrkB family protein [Candidatus Bandiella euplotis]|uniref:YihY/virulence factor BrkB family protein n=1 Tax=Candidatus Bandiella euplotis TaxID=1664265 RepID=A0ABZ0UKN4_9RICK|nr:YihY/virulence factor BrkB family protein [Candidatus Bandiella woodruffii]WPX96671.1 YihY/virulence factor BrkB family protein [Candidatus Bandiella woodruffii]